MFNSTTVGAMPFSRSSLATVRPVGPNPMTTARSCGSSDEEVAISSASPAVPFLVDRGGNDEPGRRHELRGIEQHPYRDKKQDSERIAHGERIRRRAKAVVRSSDRHPRDERAERHRHPKQGGGSHSDAERNDKHGQREQL